MAASRWRATVCSTALLALVGMDSVHGLSQKYCSSQNTGSDYSAVVNLYQSNGACKVECMQNYAFAVVQFQRCWCSNYIPANQASVGSCNDDCPGFPDEQCGNLDQGLFGYIALSKSPSGTLGAASPSSTSKTPQGASPNAQTRATADVSATVTRTVTSEKSLSPIVLITTSATSPVSTLRTSSTGRSSLVTPTPVTSVQVVTVSGARVTQTVTSTPPVAPASESQGQQGSGLSAGGVAGIVLGVILAIVALLVGAFLLWRRNKRADEDGSTAAMSSTKKKNMTRNTSVLSRTGLLSRHAPSMAENPTADDALHRHSILLGGGAASSGEAVYPASPLAGGVGIGVGIGQTGNGSGGNSHRSGSGSGRLYDQRLNPSALFANPEANRSSVSMQDQQDYSRPLGVVNPDPRPSFDSRLSER